MAHTLTINAEPHKPVHLTSHHLETWFAHLDNPGKPIEAGKTLLDSFGLNNSHDVLHFLDSPIGHAMKAQVSEALAHMAMFQKEGQRHARELFMAKNRRLAFLLLGRLHKKELAAKKHRLIEDQIQLLEDLQKQSATKANNEPSHAIHYLEFIESLGLQIQFYTETILALQENLEQLRVKSDQLEIELASVNGQLDQLDHFNTLIQNIIQAPIIPLIDLQEKIMSLTASIATSMDDRLMAWKLEIYKDMRFLHEPTQQFYTDDGRLTHEYHEAAHLLEKDYQIVKKGDKCYLLQAKQNLTALSLEEKDTAHLAYQALRLEPHRMTAHRRITKEHQALRAPLEAQQMTLLPQIAQLQQEKMTLTTQLKSVFQSRLKAIETLNRVQQLAAASNSNQPAPSANPTPTLRPMPGRQSIRPTLTPELRGSYAAISQALKEMPPAAAAALVQNNPGLRLPMRPLPRPIQLGKLPGDQIKQIVEALARYGIAANPLATRPYTTQATNRSAPRPTSAPRPF